MARNGVEAFDLPSGTVLAEGYVVNGRLGRGWEGEVYKVRERGTGVYRAAKLFYPKRNPRNRAARHYAKKLDRLRDCPILIQYHHSTMVEVNGSRVSCMFSDFVEGELLSEFVRRHPGKRLYPFAALHLIYPIVCGLEYIHQLGEYHGDIHDDNVMVRQYGIQFDVKLVDFFYRGTSTASRRRQDLYDVVRLLYDLVGGRRRYASQPPIVKEVVKGLRWDLIGRTFPTVGHLREFLETYSV